VHSLTEDGSHHTLLHNRRGIGGLALHEQGGFVVTGRNVSYKRDDATETVVLIERDAEGGRAAFADLTVDVAGRIYVGSLGEIVSVDGDAKDPHRVPGSIYLIDSDGAVREVAPDIGLANGLGFSPDGRRLYGCDSNRGVIFVWDVDAESGDLENRQQFYETNVGILDGMAISEDGCVWVALAHEGQALRISPSGKLVGSVQSPVPFVSAVCFGGPEMSTLFLTTGSEGLDDPNDASVYSTPVDVRGVEVPRARVPTSAATA
jgi:gluconolactonase